MSPAARKPTRSKGRFKPKELVLHQGFGDPQVRSLIWVTPEDLPAVKVKLAQAQDLIARTVRHHLDDHDEKLSALEERLGYKRRALEKKLNGHEAMTLEDVLQLADEFGIAVVSALTGDDNAQIIVTESAPKYASETESIELEFHTTLRRATDNLERASQLLKDISADDQHESLAESLEQLAKAINSVGASVARIQRD